MCRKELARGRRPWRAEISQRRYTAAVIRSAPSAWRACLRAFATWLERERELALSTITVRLGSTRDFVRVQAQPGGVRTLRRLDVTGIEDFFIGYAQAHGPTGTRSMQAALRLFLQFAATRNWVMQDLVVSVPSLRSYRLSGVPRGVDEDGVRTLIAAAAHGSRRDRAITLLFAAYGVRRSQVCALRLRDVDWRAHTILFRAQKGGKPVQHELTPAVAEALAAYLQHERPDVATETVFLRARKPHLPLGPSAVTSVIRGLFLQTGLASTPRGPHSLRHAFATRLLHAGRPLEVIADLLGHRSLASVAIYAKVDHPRLLEVAREWPEVVS